MANPKHQPAGNYAWSRWIRRADLPQPTKVVALILGTYANKDGSNVRVGQDRLADEAGSDTRYVRDSLAILLHLGLLEITHKGRRAGDADTYRLTTPGPGHPPIPMRRDKNGAPIDSNGEPLTGRRPKALAVRPYLDALRGADTAARPMPIERPEDPEDPEPASATGNALPPEPVDNSEISAEYRQPGAATKPPTTTPYRQPVADVPATRCPGTGNPLPPTNYYQLSTNELQLGDHLTSPIDQPCGKPTDPITDAEYEAARTTLATLNDFGTTYQTQALTELQAAGQPDPPLRAVITRAAETVRTVLARTNPSLNLTA